MIQVQVTMTSSKGYKPVSCLIDAENKRYAQEHLTELKTKGIQKICQKRLWNNHHLKDFGYTKVKMRIYDKEKIEAENAARYERIKRERGWIKQEEEKKE